MRNEEVEGKRVMTDGGWRVTELTVKTPEWRGERSGDCR